MITSPLLSGFANLNHAFGSKGAEAISSQLVTARQVHGTGLLVVTSPRSQTVSDSGGMEEADILMTETKGIAVGVKTADCLPILMAEPDRGIVAAVHAGWRGTVREVAVKAVRTIVEMGGSVDRLVAALGPCIGPCCFEVGEEVAAPFAEEFPDWSQILRMKSGSKWLLDLALTNRKQLLGMGLKPERIDRIDLCTRCRPDLFHSYRRDGNSAGRMVSWIELAPTVAG